MTNHERIEGMSNTIQYLEAKILQFRQILKDKCEEIEANDGIPPYKLLFDYDKHFGITSERKGKIE